MTEQYEMGGWLSSDGVWNTYVEDTRGDYDNPRIVASLASDMFCGDVEKTEQNY